MSDLRTIVKAVAPALATALGGPLAGSAVRVLSEQFLGTADGTSEQVAAALSVATPAQIVELRRLDHDFNKALIDAGIKLEELAAGDRANARAREAQVRDWVPGGLAALVVVGFGWALHRLLSGVAPPSESRDVLFMMLGALASALAQVLAYYFGSSSGSREKTGALERFAARAGKL